MKLNLLILAIMIGIVLNSAITFFIAYFSPGKAVFILVNKYGEANIEFILFCLIIVGCIYLIVSYAKNKELIFKSP